MNAIIEIASKNVGYIVALVTGLATMYGWIVKPIRAIQAENKKQTEKLNQLDDDTADLLCSQLIRERDFYMRQGWCPPLDKDRLAGGVSEIQKPRT